MKVALVPPLRAPLALAAVAVACLTGAALLWWAQGALATLAAARAERAGLETLLSAPPRTPPPLVARDETVATPAALARHLRLAGARDGVLIESVAAVGGQALPMIAIEIRASGPEKALLGFVGTIERGTPTVRFPAWRLEPDPAGGGIVRLRARAVAFAGTGA